MALLRLVTLEAEDMSTLYFSAKNLDAVSSDATCVGLGELTSSKWVGRHQLGPPRGEP